MALGQVNRKLFDKEAIFCSLAISQQNGSFIGDGKNTIRRAADDRTGESLAFSIHKFATGYWNSFERRRILRFK